MNSNSKNFFSPVPNYAAVREKLEAYNKKPTEKDIDKFLKFWDEAYKIWRKIHPNLLNKSRLEHKIKIRKELNKLLLNKS